MNAIDRVTMFALVKAAPKEHRAAILSAMVADTRAKLRGIGTPRQRPARRPRVVRRRVSVRRRRTVRSVADPPSEPPPSDDACSSGGLA